MSAAITAVSEACLTLNVKDYNLAYWTVTPVPMGTYMSSPKGRVAVSNWTRLRAQDEPLGSFNLYNWGWGITTGGRWWIRTSTGQRDPRQVTTLRATTDGSANANRFVLVRHWRR
jgi:hypothetical protein